MGSLGIPEIEVFEDEQVTPWSHYVMADGTALVRGDVVPSTGVLLKVLDVSQGVGDANTTLASFTIDPVTVIYDTLQDDGWAPRPYNFRHTYDWTDTGAGGTALTTTGGMRLRLQYEIDASQGGTDFGTVLIVRHVRFKPRY